MLTLQAHLADGAVVPSFVGRTIHQVESVRFGGLDVAYRRAGSGPLLVLVHGALEDSRTWTPQIAGLADKFTVVAWDEPGCGNSADLPAEGFTLSDYAACLAAVIDDVGVGPARVLGLSWGSTVALELYRVHPEAVAALVIVGGYAGWKGSLPPEEVAARLAGVKQMLEAPSSEFAPSLPGLFFGDPPTEFVTLLETMAAAVRPHSMGTSLSIMAETDLSDALPSIAVPTLLVWGEQDVRSPLAVARRFEGAIPDSSLVVIPDCGHLANLERPIEFNDAVRTFCMAIPDRNA